MSRSTGDSTRDWLLKKLLKASRALAEQQTEIKQITGAVAALREQNVILQSAIQKMASSFEVILVHPEANDVRLGILAVSMANGKTIISVSVPNA